MEKIIIISILLAVALIVVVISKIQRNQVEAKDTLYPIEPDITIDTQKMAANCDHEDHQEDTHQGIESRRFNVIIDACIDKKLSRKFIEEHLIESFPNMIGVKSRMSEYIKEKYIWDKNKKEYLLKQK